MIEIHTTNNDIIYCAMCGTQTTDGKGSVVKCPHLVYLGHDEGVEFSIYDDVEEPEDDDEWVQYDEQLKEFRKKLEEIANQTNADVRKLLSPKQVRTLDGLQNRTK